MLEIEGLRKSFGAGAARVNAADGVDLAVGAGTLLTMLGPSGCGKTTTLRCIAGLERPDAGRIVIGGRVMVDTERGVFVPPSERGIGMVFQSYAIWPHMSVFENVAFPLRVARDRRFSEADIRDAVGKALDMVRLGGTQGRHATQLSGGQQQRLAFARGIVRMPSLLLLDEPLSNLDARLRDEMRGELMRMQAALGLTTVYVTHDQAEALALSDEVALFQSGRIVQRGSPAEIYREPVNCFAATFIGAANLLPGTVLEGGSGALTVRTGDGMVRCLAPSPVATGAAVTLSIRPETIELRNVGAQATDNTLPAKVASRSFLGDVVEYDVQTSTQGVRVRMPPNIEFSLGQDVFVCFRQADCRVLTS